MTIFVQRWRPVAVHGAKLALAGLAIYWLTASHRLNFADLELLLTEPNALALTVGVWLAAVATSAWRWLLLLRALDLAVDYRRLLSLQLIAFFFNLAIPGTLGGDGARFFYAAQDLPPGSKTALLLSLVMDRLVGLMGLFTAGAIGVSMALALGFWDTHQMQTLAPLCVFVLAGFATLSLALVAFLFAPIPPSLWFNAALSRCTQRIPLLNRVVAMLLVLEQYRRQPSRVLLAIGASVLMQGAVLVLCQHLTGWLTLQRPTLAVLGAIAPLGNLLASVPLAPGGLGVGHLAFEKLYQLVGLSGGANVFNVMILSQMALNILGVVPYLARRRRSGPPSR